jgi:D-alanine-D-alanine ligase
MADRMRLALLFGGRSGEHEVSVVSARSVARSLDPDRYEVIPMAIDHRGRWADPATARTVLDGSGDRADQVRAFTGRDRLDPRLLGDGVDVVFPVLHGPFGEDGTVQGLLEILDLPYVGCDVTASALCMDKILTKRVFREQGLATPEWVEVHRHTWQQESDRLRGRCLSLGLPVFVKPARLGSSVGVTKVKTAEAFDAAVTVALEHGEWAIVERGLVAREIEVAVLGDEEPRASVPGEVVPGHEFYDYSDKYLDSACQLLAPAPLGPEQQGAVQALAVRAFRALGCSGMARADMFLERSTGLLWLNELNTIPGFTSISMYPRLWALSGLPYPTLLDELVRLALERHRRR